MRKYLLIGNPNVGKTTLFNNLTGSNEKVSNFEGVTVTHKKAIIKTTKDELIDLPGIHNLGNDSIISKSVSEMLIKEDYNSILYTADINTLKKNMYLLIEILETGKNTNLILTMTDLFKGKLQKEKLEKILNVNIYETNKKSCLNFVNIKSSQNNFKLKYDPLIEQLIENLLKFQKKELSNINNRYLALQVIKGNETLYEYFESDKKEHIKELIQKTEDEIKKQGKARSLSGLIFRKKRQFIINLLEENYEKQKDDNRKITDVIDKIVLHKFWGYIIFLFIMWLIFLISFKFAFLSDIIDRSWQIFISNIEMFLNGINIPEPIISFITFGFLGGLGAVLVFLPQILILFALLTLLVGSGYLTRVSVLFEKLFDKLGLSTYSLIPLISGLGCNVLAILSTRTIKGESKRLSIILAAPFISCSARLPVYMIFINIFFEYNKALILLSLYLLGMIVAIGVAYISEKFIKKSINEKDEILVKALPSYKMISFKYFLRSLFNKIKGFILGAGKLILIGTMLIWVLVHFNFSGYTPNIEESFLVIISSSLTFLFKPLGFGDVEAISSLFAAFFAKELAVSAMVASYGAGSIQELTSILQTHFTIASAYSFMVFTLLYIPCISTLGAILGETRKLRYVVYSVLISLGIGYLLAFIFYNIISLVA